MDDNSDYGKEQIANQDAFQKLVQDLRPDLFALMKALDDTGVNYVVPWKVMYHLGTIAAGTKYGTVSVKVENNVVTFVTGEQSDRVNEDLINKKKNE